MKKITLCVTSFSGGGAERVMVALGNKFHELGYSVDFIVFRDKGPYRGNLNPGINKIVLFGERQPAIVRRFKALVWLYRYFNEESAEVVMATLKEVNVFISFARWIAGSDVPLVLREADTLDRIFVTGGVRNKVLLYFMRVFYKRASGIIANCNVTADDLATHLQLPRDKISRVYNPLDLGGLSKTIADVKKEARTTLVACGRLVKKKNFTDLISAFPLVLKEYPDARLIILGDGDERHNLETLINNLGLGGSVRLLGFVDNPFVYYAAAHVFVQTSLWEGFGYVLAEAMACGTPVVAYDSKGAMREILMDGDYGKLVPVGDLQALATAVIDQIKNPTPTDVLSVAVKRFSLCQISNEYLDVLKASLASGK